MFLLSAKCPLLNNNRRLPEKETIIPMIFIVGVLLRKKMPPVIITKMGVSELSVPAKALSIPSSAIQNKKAGNKLPNTPLRKTINIFLSGIFLNAANAKGNSTSPEDKIRIAAT